MAALRPLASTSPATPHPLLVDLFPPLSPTELEEATERVRRYGQRDVIEVLPGERIISGLHEHEACLRAGVVPILTRISEPADLIEFVVRRNVPRHRSRLQRAAIAVVAESAHKALARDRMRAAGRLGGKSKGRGISPRPFEGERWFESAAKMVGAAPEAVRRLARIRRVAPDVFERVRTGEVKKLREARALTGEKLVCTPQAREGEESASTTLGARPGAPAAPVSGGTPATPMGDIREEERVFFLPVRRPLSTVLADRYQLIEGEVLEHLRSMPDNSVDGVLSDPPYGLGEREPTVPELIAYLQGDQLDTGGDFMGYDWHVPSVAVWREVFRVLKPGAHVLAFAGTRTQDLVALGMRAAGFEIRDSFIWLYGQGMPKSFNASKAIDKAAGVKRKVVGRQRLTGRAAQSGAIKGGFTFTALAPPSAGCEKFIDINEPATAMAKRVEGYGTALKPGHEPILVARKPLEGSVVANIRKWGTGLLAIDACRIGTNGATKRSAQAAYPRSEDGREDRTHWARTGHNVVPLEAGRWPANVLLDEHAAEELDAQSGIRPAGWFSSARKRGMGYGGADSQCDGGTSRSTGDEGGASRFFYVAKPSRRERDLGLEDLPEREAITLANSTIRRCREHDKGIKSASTRYTCGCPIVYGETVTRTAGRNPHPTLKPIRLVEHLARLILPPNGGTLLVPFSGSGSEVIGALKAGWDRIIGIEREPEFIAIAHRRVAAHVGDERERLSLL